MTLRVKISGAPITLLDELEAEFATRVPEVMDEAGDLLVAEVEHLLGQRKGPAPAPSGEPPAVQDGFLLRSVSRIPTKLYARSAVTGVQVDEEGVNRLEYGFTDRRGIRTLPHPFVRPAVDNVRDRVVALLETLVPGGAARSGG